MKTCFEPSESRTRAFATAVLVTLALTMGLVSCASFDHLTQVNDTFPQAADCGKCHIDIYDEWNTSDHARAYPNPHFQAATDDYAFDDCLNCHAPEPRLTEQTPAVRSARRNESVTCVSCHLNQGAQAGPLEATGKVKPHPIAVRPEVYHNPGICGRCHQGTLEQWTSVAGEKKTCQQCHMPEVTRKMTQSSGGFSKLIVSLEHETLQRRHVFAIAPPESVRDMLEVEVRRNDAGAEIALHNRLPHRLPTGDYGFRILVLEVSVLDENGEEHSVAHAELAPEMKTDIPPLGTWNHLVSLPAGTVSVRVRLQRYSYGDQAVMDLLDRIVEL